MNAKEPIGRRNLDDLMRKPDPTPKPTTPPADPETVEAEDGCGLSSTRGMYQGFILEMENRNREGIFYGAILGRVRFDPSRGVSFVFEAEDGMHKVEITGNNLEGLHRDLTLGRRESVRIGEAVTGIEVKAWSPPPRK